MKRIFHAAICLVVAFYIYPAAGQSGAEWNTYKQQNGIAMHWTYNDWVNAGMPHDGQSGSPSGIPSGGNSFQQMQQQIMLQGASAVGQALGQSLGEMLFGSPEDQARQQAQEQARQAELARQAEAERQAAEQARLARVAIAAKLRNSWNASDEAMSQQLSGVFDIPLGKSVSRSKNQAAIDGAFDDTSIVDLRAPSTGTKAFGEANSSGLVDDSGNPSLVDLRYTSAGGPAGFQPTGVVQNSFVVSDGGSGIVTGAVNPEFLAAERKGVLETDAFMMSHLVQPIPGYMTNRDIFKATQAVEGTIYFGQLENIRQVALYHYAMLPGDGNMSDALEYNYYLGNFGPDEGVANYLHGYTPGPLNPLGQTAAIHDAKGANGGDYSLWFNGEQGPFNPKGHVEALVQSIPSTIRYSVEYLLCPP